MVTTTRSEPTARVLIDESRPHLFGGGSGRPIRVYDWTPGGVDGGDAPLVVISHGTGGSGRDMGWLARALVAAGLRVLSLDHHGNNHVDGYHPEGFLLGWERPRDITFLLDAIGHVDRVGVAGFSLGGYTCAALAGARLDSTSIEAILSGAVPMPPIEELPDALERLQAEQPSQGWAALAEQAASDRSDPRVAAAFLVAPGMGQLMTQGSLRTVGIPVEIRWGDADTTNPYDVDVRPLLDHLPRAHGEEVGPGVGHSHFIAPLTPEHADVRARVASDAATFFTRHLGRS